MLTVTDSSVILGAIRERKRTVRLLLAVTNAGSAVYSESRLKLNLRDAHGHLMAEMTLEGGAVSPGAQVLTFQTALPDVAVAAVDGELQCWLGRWVSPVSGVAPFQAPRAASTPAVAAPPKVSTPKAPPWERFAINRAARARPVQPIQSPDGPWAALDAGDVETAMARFDRHRLDELGQHRLRALLTSSDPVELAWGCQISRLVRWVTPSTMLPLLSHVDPRVRQEAVDSLGRVAGAGVQAQVAPLLDDDNAAVRQAAALCMQRITGKAARW